MTEEQVIKALECCCTSNNNDYCCENCTYERIGLCASVISKEALDLINSQKENLNLMRSDLIEVSHNYEHIKRLYEEEKARVIRWQKLFLEAQKKLKSVKSETVKAVCERLKATFPARDDLRCTLDDCYTLDAIDNIAKELIEGSKQD